MQDEENGDLRKNGPGVSWRASWLMVGVFAVGVFGARGVLADPPTGAVAPASEPSVCERYCDALLKRCQGVGAALPTRGECLAACALWPSGDPRDETGGTQACRTNWLAAARSVPQAACKNAGLVAGVCCGGLGRPCGASGGGASADAKPQDGMVEGTQTPIASVGPRPAGRCVVGIRDGSDAWYRGAAARSQKTFEDRIRPALREMGLDLRVLDVQGGLPTDAQMGDCRGIITLSEDYLMPEAAAFNAWLAAQMDAGRRVVVFNHYPALVDAGDNQVLSLGIVNAVFRRLGVSYLGLEGNDKRTMKSGPKGDRSVFAKRPARPRQAGHVRAFVRPAADVVVHQWVKFKTPSKKTLLCAVVFTSPRGGLALVRYFESKDGKTLRLDLPRFLTRAGFGD